MNISFTYQAGGRRGEGKLARCGQIIRLQKKGNSKTNIRLCCALEITR